MCLHILTIIVIIWPLGPGGVLDFKLDGYVLRRIRDFDFLYT